MPESTVDVGRWAHVLGLAHEVVDGIAGGRLEGQPLEPMLQDLGHLCDPVGARVHAVDELRRVRRDVEQESLLAAEPQLPVTHPQCVVAIGADPVEVLLVPVGAPVDGLRLAQQPVQQARPVEVPSWPRGHSGGVRHRGGEVERRDRLVNHEAGRDPTTPVRQHRHLDPALPHRLLGATQRDVLRAHVRDALVHATGRDPAGLHHAAVVILLIVVQLDGRSVVGRKDEQRLVVQVFLLQEIHDAPHTRVDRFHHRQASAPRVVLHLGHEFVRLNFHGSEVVVPVCKHWLMWPVGRPIEKERMVRVALDEALRKVSRDIDAVVVVVMQPLPRCVARGFGATAHNLFFVASHHATIRVNVREEMARRAREELVEPSAPRVDFGVVVAPQVPFARHARCIT
mmetsp:Transcript_24419/g.58504  ORF Transcript_24419/g.58504 Transcript_24419/m.58504 type:complete len:398 (+) Transcript_24419:957-2150(+)